MTKTIEDRKGLAEFNMTRIKLLKRVSVLMHYSKSTLLAQRLSKKSRKRSFLKLFCFISEEHILKDFLCRRILVTWDCF